MRCAGADSASRPRVSAPVAIAQQQLGRLLPEFLERYPDVRVQLHVSNRRVDLIN